MIKVPPLLIVTSGGVIGGVLQRGMYIMVVPRNVPCTDSNY